HSHGTLTANATEPAWNGYLLTVACLCRVVFQQWVTPEDADRDLIAWAKSNEPMRVPLVRRFNSRRFSVLRSPTGVGGGVRRCPPFAVASFGDRLQLAWFANAVRAVVGPGPPQYQNDQQNSGSSSRT